MCHVIHGTTQARRKWLYMIGLGRDESIENLISMINTFVRYSMSKFRFKQFQVSQAKSAMKIGTDGVLLGAWADHSNPTFILDIGTGTGLIALMLAQRFSQAKIEAVEIEKQAFLEAEENFTNSPFANRLNALHLDFNQFQSTKRYDLIVSNPPFFENSLLASSEERSTARHTHTLPFSQLLNKSNDLLSKHGRLAVVLPSDAEKTFITEACRIGLHCNLICRVKGREELPAKRIMMTFSSEPGLLTETELVVEKDRHVYTDEYVALTRDFYLKM